jgi:hypothetical protein
MSPEGERGELSKWANENPRQSKHLEQLLLRQMQAQPMHEAEQAVMKGMREDERAALWRSAKTHKEGMLID